MQKIVVLGLLKFEDNAWKKLGTLLKLKKNNDVKIDITWRLYSEEYAKEKRLLNFSAN